jgi:hypothetical protein
VHVPCAASQVVRDRDQSTRRCDDLLRPSIYLCDLAAKVTTLISVDATGAHSGNDAPLLPIFSADGTRIAFASVASDLGPTDTNRALDIYVRDLTTRTTNLVSSRHDGADAGDGPSGGGVSLGQPPLFSFMPGGVRVVFSSQATNLDLRDGGTDDDVFIASVIGRQ